MIKLSPELPSCPLATHWKIIFLANALDFMEPLAPYTAIFLFIRV